MIIGSIFFALFGNELYTPTHMQNQGGESPRVFDYLDYREYLRDFYNIKKQNNPAFSLGTFAQKANIKTRNYLKRIIDGERSLSRDNLPKFCMALNLNHKESQYFEYLVQYNQAKEDLVRKYYFEQLKAAAAGVEDSKIELDQAQYEIFSHWYIIPTLELLTVKSLKADARSIAKALGNRITVAEARKALEILEKIGLAEKETETGQYKKTAKQVSYSKDILNIAVQTYHRAMLELTTALIESEPLDKRYLRALTLMTSKEEADAIKSQVNELLKKINALYSKSEVDSGVLTQINVQVLQLTNHLGREKNDSN